MRLMTRLCCIPLVGCVFLLPALLAAADKPQRGAKDDARLLEGSWQAVALETDGKKAPPEPLKAMRWSFKGSELQESGPLASKYSVKLDSNKTPKYIDLVVLEGPLKGKTIQGIFKFEKDRLVVCLRGLKDAQKGRPTQFMTEPDTALALITLERIKE